MSSVKQGLGLKKIFIKKRIIKHSTTRWWLAASQNGPCSTELVNFSGKEISTIYNRGVTAVISLRVFCLLFTDFLSAEAWLCIQNLLTLLQEDCFYCRASLPFHDGSLYPWIFCRLWLRICKTSLYCNRPVYRIQWKLVFIFLCFSKIQDKLLIYINIFKIKDKIYRN